MALDFSRLILIIDMFLALGSTSRETLIDDVYLESQKYIGNDGVDER